MIDVDAIPDQFWIWLQRLLFKTRYGRVEMTIIEGGIDSVRLETSYKPRLAIDNDGSFTIECNE